MAIYDPANDDLQEGLCPDCHEPLSDLGNGTLECNNPECGLPAEAATTRPRIVIVIEGGLVQEVLSDVPVDYALVDYDTEGADDSEVAAMPQDNGKTAACYGGISTCNVLPERVAEMFSAFEEEPAGAQ